MAVVAVAAHREAAVRRRQTDAGGAPGGEADPLDARPIVGVADHDRHRAIRGPLVGEIDPPTVGFRWQ